MNIVNTRFKNLKIIEHNSYKDKRGFLRITHVQKELNKKFIFEYCTTSKKYSLRGFHFQHRFQQAKYVTVLKGKILDCVIDLRKKSKTFIEDKRVTFGNNDVNDNYATKSSNKLKRPKTIIEHDLDKLDSPRISTSKINK